MFVPLAATCAVVLPSCGRQPVRVVDVSETRVVKKDLRLGRNLAERFGTGSSSSRPPRQSDSPAGGGGMPSLPPLGWKLPDGWSEKPKTQFRMGSFASPGNGDCSVSVAGGDLRENVNRWRGQFGQQPLDAAGIAELTKRPVMNGRVNGHLVECRGAYTSMRGEKIDDAALLGVVIPVGPTVSMFVKFVGPSATVVEQRENFFALCDSLYFESAGSNAPAPSGGRLSLAWSLPDDWQEVPSGSRYRTVTAAPKSNPAVQCWVSQLSGNGGGVRNNVNRWLGEIGQPYLGPTAIAALPTIKVLDRDSVLIEAFGNYKGQNGESRDAGLLGVVCEHDSNMIFIKMVGPSDAVRAEKENFTNFCTSLEAR